MLPGPDDCKDHGFMGKQFHFLGLDGQDEWQTHEHLQLKTARYAPVLISLHGLLWVIGGCALGTSPGHKQSSARATSGTSMFEQAPSVECFDNTTRKHYNVILPQFPTLTAS